MCPSPTSLTFGRVHGGLVTEINRVPGLQGTHTRAHTEGERETCSASLSILLMLCVWWGQVTRPTFCRTAGSSKAVKLLAALVLFVLALLRERGEGDLWRLFLGRDGRHGSPTSFSFCYVCHPSVQTHQ